MRKQTGNKFKLKKKLNELEFRTICHNGKIEKRIHFINGRIKQLLYCRCKELIVCRNTLLERNPVISVYPSPKTLIGKFKSMMFKRYKEKELDWDDIFRFS